MTDAIQADASKIGVSIGGLPMLFKLISTCSSIGIPFVGSLYALFYIFNNGLGWIEITCFLVFYTFVGIGVGIGFHRCFTHQGFIPSPFLKIALLFGGSMAFQGSVIRWVADHRRHHRFTDEPWDTHSPYFYKGRLFKSRLRGLLHAHVGWMFDPTTTSSMVYVPDLLADRQVRLFQYLYFPCCIMSLFLPWLYGWILGGANAAFRCLLVGGFLRVSVFQHVVWSVNSIGHWIGNRRSTRHDQSRNNFPLALLTFGDGWHNNHHAQPRAAFHGWRRDEIDVNALIIRALARLGLLKAIVHPVNAEPPLSKETADHISEL